MISMVEKEETGRYGVEGIVRLVFGRGMAGKGCKGADHLLF